uniref:F-box domain-containing protein n=1 Tax=Leersia perrieri TaxID=77586 RepID=A0A0D9XBR8_9ORYZ
MSAATSRCAAVACRRLSRRLLSTATSAPLLGHFHHPTPVPPKGDPPTPYYMAPAAVATFHPLTAASPRLSLLDFLPDAADFELFDSHLGLLLLRRHNHNRNRKGDLGLYLVCDPVSRRSARFPPPPILGGGRIIGAALLSRDADADPGSGLRFDAVCVAVDGDRPRAWVATYRDGECRWRALPRGPRDVAIEFDPYWLENTAVRAAGGLYWHICNNRFALALDMATLQFSFLLAPYAMWRYHKFRIGEMPADGQLCVGSLEDEGFQLWVRGSGRGSDNGWVRERHVRMQEVLDEVPWLPRDIKIRHCNMWLSDIDAGRTGKVFVASFGYGRFSYHLDTGKLECLAMEDGMEYGHPIFPYFSTPGETLVPPPPIAVLTDHDLREILRRLAPADLIRAALACHRWRRAAARCACVTSPPLLGYFFHPVDPPPTMRFSASRARRYPVAFVPVDASSPTLSLDGGDGTKGFSIFDVHLGLVLLLPVFLPFGIPPRILVVDPASRRRVLLPPPPRDLLPEQDDCWRGGDARRHFVGAALLSRAHPSMLCFDALILTVDDKHPRASIASYRDGECSWMSFPRDMGVTVKFDPYWFEGRCVHAAGDIYWHICQSGRVLKLDPATLTFSYLRAPSELLASGANFRIGETPEDGRLAMATVENQEMQFWVRGEAKENDDGWFLRKRMNMRKVFDTMPALPRDKVSRIMSIWLSDIDRGRTGKLFIKTEGYGRYSFHMEAAKLERLITEDGKEYGHPIYAYRLAWPPAFLAPEGGNQAVTTETRLSAAHTPFHFRNFGSPTSDDSFIHTSLLSSLARFKQYDGITHYAVFFGESRFEPGLFHMFDMPW